MAVTFYYRQSVGSGPNAGLALCEDGNNEWPRDLAKVQTGTYVYTELTAMWC
jgi:hypothetical protein